MSIPPPPPTNSPPHLVYRSAVKETFWPMKLHFAINNHDINKVKYLVKENVNLDYKVFNQTPLTVAIFQECFDIACYLVENGASLDFREGSKLKRSPIHLAAKSGCLELVEKMLEMRPDIIEARDSGGMSALHWAALENQARILEFLVLQGAEIDGVDNKGMSALQIAVLSNSLKGVESLLSLGADGNSYDNDGCTPLMRACSHSFFNIAQVLLIKGKADPNIISHCGISCLYLTCQPFDESIISYISTRNSFSNCKPISSTYISKETQKDLMILLLNHGADVDLCSQQTGTPLNWALSYNHPNLVRLLLDAGCLPDDYSLALLKQMNICGTRPLPLMRLSKKTIHKTLGRFINEKITLLSLPSSLKAYLTIMDA